MSKYYETNKPKLPKFKFGDCGWRYTTLPLRKAKNIVPTLTSEAHNNCIKIPFVKGASVAFPTVYANETSRHKASFQTPAQHMSNFQYKLAANYRKFKFHFFVRRLARVFVGIRQPEKFVKC